MTRSLLRRRGASERLARIAPPRRPRRCYALLLWALAVASARADSPLEGVETPAAASAAGGGASDQTRSPPSAAGGGASDQTRSPGAGPAALRLEWVRAGPLFGGTTGDLRVFALDAKGAPLREFTGVARLEGLVRRDGTPMLLSGPFEHGEALIEKVKPWRGEVRARIGSAVGVSRPSIWPGVCTLLPAAVAILLALATRQVLLALFAGVWCGALLLGGGNPFTAFLAAIDTYLVGALSNRDHASIILFSLTLAGMVGIITRSGGVRGVVDRVSRLARGARSGQLATWLLGVLIFFDDYANTLIVGNTMRPFTDRARISREKLSFIVDATAAPVATIGVISTWTAYQVGLISEVLPHVPTATPEPYLYFLRSIPASFYSFFMIFLVAFCAVTMRDFGPMLAAERRARSSGAVLRDGAQPLIDPSLDRLGDSPGVTPRALNAVAPIVAVVLFTLGGLWATGRASLAPDELARAGAHEIFGAADAYRALLWASAGASFLAALLARASGVRVPDIVESWVRGARALVVAAMILVLAWAIGRACRDLRVGEYVVSLTEDFLRPGLLPAIAFASAGIIAFATGTSYGTMSILIPILIPWVYEIAPTADLSPAAADQLGVGTLAAVLGGAVFGDHCSPISDTTVLSSMASGADHVDHVRTQLPYALLAAGVSLPAYLLLGLGFSAGIVLPAGIAVLAGLFWWLSRTRREPPTPVRGLEREDRGTAATGPPVRGDSS